MANHSSVQLSYLPGDRAQDKYRLCIVVNVGPAAKRGTADELGDGHLTNACRVPNCGRLLFRQQDRTSHRANARGVLFLEEFGHVSLFHVD